VPQGIANAPRLAALKKIRDELAAKKRTEEAEAAEEAARHEAWMREQEARRAEWLDKWAADQAVAIAQDKVRIALARKNAPLLVSAQLCKIEEDKRDVLARIADEKRTAKKYGGGVVDMKLLHDLGYQAADLDDEAAEWRAVLRKHYKSSAMACSGRVRAVYRCLYEVGADAKPPCTDPTTARLLESWDTVGIEGVRDPAFEPKPQECGPACWATMPVVSEARDPKVTVTH
jgi:hypothetical protein